MKKLNQHSRSGWGPACAGRIQSSLRTAGILSIEGEYETLKKWGRPVPMSQDDNKNRVHVRIFGEEYTMRGNASPEYMKRVAYYVDEKMKLVGQANTRLGINKVAVLTAINLADELFRVRKELRELETLLEKKTAQ